MAEAELGILLKLRDEATKGLQNLEKQLGMTQKQMRNMGIGMMAAGGAIAAGLGLAVKAANEERIGIMRLQTQLKNVGVAYDDVKGSLEKVISATQYKTGIADDEQRVALGDLVMITGDYKRSLELLPLALDLAAAKQMDVSTAAELIGKVVQGNFSILSRYGIVLKEGATAAEALAEIQKKVAGTAEATRDPFKVLNAQIGDLKEAIGTALLPVLTGFLDKATKIIERIKDWIAIHPELIKGLAIFAGVLIGAGGLLFAFSQIAKAIMVINAALIILHSLSGVGILKMLAGLAIAAAAILGMTKLMGGLAAPEVPSMQYGGIVPGPLGKPRLIMAHGGEPFGGVGGKAFGNTYVTVQVQGSVVGERDLAETIRRELLLIKERNVNVGLT